MSVRMKFTFVSLTYNQEDYIMEHLESIKYQILNFGIGMDFQLIIADDCSCDKTIEYVKYWTFKNKNLFWKVNIVSDSINRGTCHNFTKVWELIEGNFCKTCAGDDVYSYNNLFNYYNELNENEVVSGIPLMLIDGTIIKSRGNIFHILASDVIYKNKNFRSRLEKISVINSPNIITPLKCYKNQNLFEFIRKYRVTEDFPLLIKMSEEYNPLKFAQIPEVLIYYRRTRNSTYIIKNKSFNNDKVEIFEYLISKSTTSIERFMLKNRLKCFKMTNKYFKKILNLNYYAYGVKVVFHFISIRKEYKKVNLDIASHQKHMNYIVDSSKAVLEDYNSQDISADNENILDAKKICKTK